MHVRRSCHRFRQTLLALTAAGIATAPGAFFVGATTATAAGSPVKIGVEGPMTGPQSATGLDMWRGVSLVVDKVNAAGGVLGHKIELIKIDDKANPQIAVAVARSAIAQHVRAVIGPYNSSVGIANLPVYRNAGVVTVRLTSNHATDGMGITVQPMDYQVAGIESSAILKSLPAKSRVAIIYDTSAYTSGIAAQLRTLLVSGGLNVNAFDSVTSTQSNFGNVLAKAKASRPALTYYVAYDPQAEDLVKQAHALSLPGICFVDGLAAEGPTFVRATGIALARQCAYSGVPTAVEFPESRQYVSEYKSEFHEDPGTWGAFSYDSASLLFQAVEQSKGWTSKVVNARLDKTVGFRGITGTISIDPKTGSRVDPPIVLLTVDTHGNYVISSSWKRSGGLPSLPT